MQRLLYESAPVIRAAWISMMTPSEDERPWFSVIWDPPSGSSTGLWTRETGWLDVPEHLLKPLLRACSFCSDPPPKTPGIALRLGTPFTICETCSWIMRDIHRDQVSRRGDSDPPPQSSSIA